jgi:hypothetical protein
VEKVACYDFKEVITMSYMELDKVALISSRKIPTTSIFPYRVVELDVFNLQHKMWLFLNINFLAPISKHMCQLWGNISREEALGYACAMMWFDHNI